MSECGGEECGCLRDRLEFARAITRSMENGIKGVCGDRPHLRTQPHLVGMAVYDVGDRYRNKDKKIHFGLEDTIVITETGAPVDPGEIEEMIAKQGLME